MSYDANTSKYNIELQYLVILKPRYFVSQWFLDSGTKYYRDFLYGDYGQIVNVDNNGVSQTQASDATLSDGVWYYDVSEKRLWIDIGSNPGASGGTNYTVVTYELYLSTKSVSYYRDPSDTSSATVFYNGLIKTPPKLQQSVTDILFGFFPTRSTTMTCDNNDKFFDVYLYESSFNRIEISVWHYAGELSSSNAFNILNGVVGGDVSTDRTSVSFNIFETTDLFEKEYRNPSSGDSFWNTTSFSNLDPTKLDTPIRRGYGVVEGFVPVNLDFNSDAPTTSNNRKWGVGSTPSGSNSGFIKMFSGTAATSNTTTRTYLPSPAEGFPVNGDGASGLQVGDTIVINDATLTPVLNYVEVTAVNYTSNYIDHAALSAPATSAASVERAPVAFVKIVQSGVAYKAFYGRDYSVTNSDTGSTQTFTFTSTMESNIGGAMVTLTPNDLVFCRYYGPSEIPQIAASDFGTRNQKTYNITNAAVILYEILKDKVGIAESDIDTAAFQSEETSAPDLSFAIDELSDSQFPTYKQVIQRILASGLYYLYKKSDGQWSIFKDDPSRLVTATQTITGDQYLFGSLKYRYSYKDIYDSILIEYAHREINEKNEAKSQSTRSSYTTKMALYLHKAEKQKIIKTYLLESSEADDLAEDVAKTLGNRQGRTTLTMKRDIFKIDLDDVVDVNSEFTPGYIFDPGTERSRKYAIEQTSKSVNSINLTLNDKRRASQ